MTAPGRITRRFCRSRQLNAILGCTELMADDTLRCTALFNPKRLGLLDAQQALREQIPGVTDGDRCAAAPKKVRTSHVRQLLARVASRDRS